MTSDPVAMELEAARQSLLDLTLRNRLLNYKPTRRSSVPIIDELPEQVWDHLFNRQKSMGFLAIEDNLRVQEHVAQQYDPAQQTDATTLTDDELAELFPLPSLSRDEQQQVERHRDRNLQTTLKGPALQTTLLRTFQAAHSSLEERGVNVLFLAFGFIKWQTDDQPQRNLLAPMLLLPVQLKRTSARKRFSLSATDDDPVINPCLNAKLIQDYQMQLPGEPESWSQWNIHDFLQQVETLISPQPQWQVQPTMALGLFSFTKYMMYLDLDPTRHGRDGLPANPLIRAMCGDQSVLETQQLEVPDPDQLDQTPPHQRYTVLDADSSQLQAITAASTGLSMVIEGPPGTGKSQTIANIIAQCLANDQTVLFVSQKAAALEVVKRRLEQARLADFLLELHSTKANRRHVLSDLDRLLRRQPIEPVIDDNDQPLWRLQQQLNTYADQLHQRIGRSRLTCFQAIGRIALLRHVPDLPAEMPQAIQWHDDELAERRHLVEQVARQLAIIGPPNEHAWHGVQQTGIDQGQSRALLGNLQLAHQALIQYRDAAEKLADCFQIQPPHNSEQIEHLINIGQLLDQAPPLPAELITNQRWQAPANEIQSLLQTLADWQQAYHWLAPRYKPELVSQVDLKILAENYQQQHRTWWRWLNPRWWQTRRTVNELRQSNHQPGPLEQQADFRQIQHFQQLSEHCRQWQTIGTDWFATLWQSTESDLNLLQQAATWLTTFHRCKTEHQLPDAVDRCLTDPQQHQEFEQAWTALTRARDQWQQSWQRIVDDLQIDPVSMFDLAPEQIPLQTIEQRLTDWPAQSEALVDWCRYQQILNQADALQLHAFFKRAVDQDLAPEILPTVFDKQYLRTLIESALHERSALAAFHGPDHEADMLGYAKLDRQWIADTAVRLQRLLRERQPIGGFQAAGSSQLGILQGEIRRKRGGRSIRSLLRDCGEMMLKLKPCFMMSPLSIAQFIAPDGLQFDVVIFDEASQVEPADALGAIARANQLILVGDPKQLPPTRFFDSLADDSATTPRAADEGATLSDMQSILDRGSIALPTLRLRWHYRSRHESLIAFSNDAFYDNDLIIFPSPDDNRQSLGLSLAYHPEDNYDRGKSQKNRDQARRIVDAVFDHIQRHPDLSLGVGTFSVAQQTAVLDELERRRREDDRHAGFFSDDQPEPFFVKNLETIQGDERDVIFLSIGYGKPDEHGKLSMNFGPLNREGGWRRLNVLITRARKRCTIFSSIVPEDFNISQSTPRGVVALHDYLKFARHGELVHTRVSDAEFHSPFEQAVHHALVERGYHLKTQIGCAGYAIDLAVIDPDRPGHYIIGIECDGATYHSSVTARDRDRLRRQVLESLGWRIARVWSTDWFRQPDRELDRLVQTIEQAKAGQLAPRLSNDTTPRPPIMIDQAEPPTPSDAQTDTADPARIIGAEPYRLYQDQQVREPELFYTCPLNDLATLATRIIRTEGPIERELLAKRLSQLFGLSRTGKRVVQRSEQALAMALGQDQIMLNGRFAWPADMTEPPIRTRENETVRDIALICDQEIELIIQRLLASQFGMTRADLIAQTARVLGFAAVRDRIESGISELIDQMLDRQRIQIDSRQCLTVIPTPDEPAS